MMENKRLIFVSNRLPLTVSEEGEQFQLRPSSGGLVTALRPILQASDGCWVGWTGTGYSPELGKFLASAEYEHCQLVPVLLTEEERRDFYCGFANEIVWPLFHDLQSRCNFDPAYWKAYLSVNRKFAQEVARVATHDSIVWVHDYHLMMLGSMLRKLGLIGKLGFFQHIPFPPADIFEKLPWRSEILGALLDFDVVGFQTPRDQKNFVSCIRRLLPNVELQRTPERLLAFVGSHIASIGTFPISIDFEEFSGEASLPAVAQRAAEIRRDVNRCQIVLGVDRLDYTKGVPERLRAFQNLLAAHPELDRRLTLIQVVVPSREDIPKYQELKLDIERLVSQINGHYGGPGWVPIHYIHRHLERPELIALYRAADIALITPLKDGMNLVAKEFCAAQVEDEGVLVLSEFAGAAEELRNGAMLVNPYDIERVADALFGAFSMDAAERQSRMRRLRRKIRKENVFRWCEAFCAHLENLGAVPPTFAGQDSPERMQLAASGF
jgi:alpha,alpha-trehalose-phosphate synthase [UDP-forming]